MNLINIKQSKKYPDLYIKKYNNKVFFKNLWHLSSDLLEARGHIIDSNDNIIVNPFTKVFNYKENNTTIGLEELCLVIDKINGFMACLTLYNGEVLVSTTGSLDSDYVDMARSYLKYAIDYIKNNNIVDTTFIFEICHHNDPHIIPENIGAYLIGSRSTKDTNTYTTNIIHQLFLNNEAKLMRVARPQYKLIAFKEVLKRIQECKHEGYMVYSLESKSVLKLKSPHYLFLKYVARKKDVLALDKTRVDEEFYDLIDIIKDDSVHFNSLDEQAKLDYVRNILWS